MPQANSPRPLPRPFIVIGSIFAVGHLLAVGLLALAAESGPWPTNFGIPSKSIGPKFATAISDNLVKPYYLAPLRMTNDYHFKSNMSTPYAAYFEAILKNDRGDIFMKLTFPDPKANFWVRHRQEILAQGLAQDQPLPPQMSEKLPVPGQELQTVEFWDFNQAEPNVLRLKSAPSHLVPRDRSRPSEWSRLLAESYMRHLAKEHNAASVELVRHSREIVLPDYMFAMRPDQFSEKFKETLSYFGEHRREE